jgi:hypothetical protein
MDHAWNESSHRAVVDAWIEQTIDDSWPTELVVDAFRTALESLWDRAVTTLGSATLTAIAERVLSTATRRYSFLSAINPRPNGDMRWKQLLRERLATVARPKLLEGLRFAMIELLTVIGRLTAEILGPELHAALDAVSASAIDANAPTALHAVPPAATRKMHS